MKKMVSLRLDTKLVELARRASDKDNNPYAPTLTQIVERGIRLALEELGRRKPPPKR